MRFHQPYRAGTTLSASVLGLASALAISSTQAVADVTRGATAVSSQIGTEFGSLGLIIDQSGLSAGYTQGVTDFASHVASTLHTGGGNTEWQSGFVFMASAEAVLSFDLGAPYAINGIAVWNLARPAPANKSLTSFDLYADNDADPTNGMGTFISDFFMSVPGGPQVGSEAFNFAVSHTRYLQMHMTGNQGTPSVGLGEVVFSQQMAPVPEPTTALMGLLGVAGVAAAVRRRRAKR